MAIMETKNNIRERMIEKIEKTIGVSDPTRLWASWTDKEVNKLYVFILIGAPHYFEDVELIVRG